MDLMQESDQHRINGASKNGSDKEVGSSPCGCGMDRPDPYGGTSKNGAKGDRVICTHFMRKGMMDPALWRADIAFTRQHLPAAMVRGYHLWAIPYVRLMRRSPWAEKLMLPLALWRAEEIAFRMGLREKGNWKGKLLRWTGEPVCWLIGKVTPEQDWESLWRENSAAV